MRTNRSLTASRCGLLWAWVFALLQGETPASAAGRPLGAAGAARAVIEAAPGATPVDVPTLQRIYDEVKTPFKHGIVVRGRGRNYVDCPSVFRHGGKWFMAYIEFDHVGYETWLAESEDLLSWKPLGKILSRGSGGWDTEQLAGFIALQDHQWGGTYALQPHDGRYWLSYCGGALKGYETDPLAVGIASTVDPSKPGDWNRLKQAVLSRDQSDVRHWEKLTQYKSNIILDTNRSLGWPFIMFYNAKSQSGYERIGLAVSSNMVGWVRYGQEPVIDNGKGISGDPQIARVGDVWVMFYFGAFWRPGAFDTFACSRDLVHWTKWAGPDLVAPSEPWDKQYAHKPWVIKHNGVVYHFYCAVGDQGRVIALATSKDLKASAGAASAEAALTPQAVPPPVAITVRCDEPRGELKPIWRFFGYDEANYTYWPDGKKLLSDIAKLSPQPAYIRAHHLLTSGDGTPWLKWSSSGAYSEDAGGQPVYSWTILDRIFDTWRERGLKPLVEVGFMPQALSVKPEPYTNPFITNGPPKDSVGRGWAYPPNDYRKWEQFIEAWARHCAERYGQTEAESWLWELWNEPNISYWRGTPEEYNRLYDHTATAVKRALPRARMGGPHTAGTQGGAEKFLRQFIEHCLRGTNAATGQTGTALDFVAFHAKGGTAFKNGYVEMNLGNHLRIVDHGFEIIASYPQLKGRQVIIGESDPDGCAACSARFFPQNGYRNGAQYASYTAATFMRKLDLAGRHGVNFEGAVTWAFEFEDQPWFDGFRVLATHGVALPVFNAFRMFSLLGPQRVAVENSVGRSLDDLMKTSVRAGPDVDAVATRAGNAVIVLVWHYHDSGTPGPVSEVELNLAGLPPEARIARLTHWRLDDEHSNAHTAWLKVGSPQDPTPEQYAAMQRASELTLLEPARNVTPVDGIVKLRFTMPRQSLSLIRAEW